jgi:hypothetical protein
MKSLLLDVVFLCIGYKIISLKRHLFFNLRMRKTYRSVRET